MNTRLVIDRRLIDALEKRAGISHAVQSIKCTPQTCIFTMVTAPLGAEPIRISTPVISLHARPLATSGDTVIYRDDIEPIYRAAGLEYEHSRGFTAEYGSIMFAMLRVDDAGKFIVKDYDIVEYTVSGFVEWIPRSVHESGRAADITAPKSVIERVAASIERVNDIEL